MSNETLSDQKKLEIVQEIFFQTEGEALATERQTADLISAFEKKRRDAGGKLPVSVEEQEARLRNLLVIEKRMDAFDIKKNIDRSVDLRVIAGLPALNVG